MFFTIHDDKDNLRGEFYLDLYAREHKRSGVVPAKIQQLIQEIEQLAGAAKICGAGTVVGENEGMVLVLLPDLGSMQALLAKYNYPLMELAVELGDAGLSPYMMS